MNISSNNSSLLDHDYSLFPSLPASLLSPSQYSLQQFNFHNISRSAFIPYNFQAYLNNLSILIPLDLSSSSKVAYCHSKNLSSRSIQPCKLWKLCPSCAYSQYLTLRSRFHSILQSSSFAQNSPFLHFLTLAPTSTAPLAQSLSIWDSMKNSLRSNSSILGFLSIEELSSGSLISDSFFPHMHCIVYSNSLDLSLFSKFNVHSKPITSVKMFSDCLRYMCKSFDFHSLYNREKPDSHFQTYNVLFKNKIEEMLYLTRKRRQICFGGVFSRKNKKCVLKSDKVLFNTDDNVDFFAFISQ